MAMKKGGLGKGLEALFAENAMEDEGRTVTLPIGEIVPNRAQPRKQFDDEALAELADSIASHGVLQPLLVRPLTDGSYQLVAGERRWRASRMAGLAEVPVVVREMSDREAAELALIENLQREDLNPMEEAQGYQTLMEAYGLTQEEAARVVNKSRPAVANSLRLLHLPEPVKELVGKGRLAAGHARALLAFPEELREQMAEETLEKGLTVHELERRARQSGGKTKKSEAVKAFAGNPLHREVELALAEQMGRRVRVTAGRKGGTLQVEFLDDADLKALANRLTGEDKEAVKLI